MRLRINADLCVGLTRHLLHIVPRGGSVVHYAPADKCSEPSRNV